VAIRGSCSVLRGGWSGVCGSCAAFVASGGAHPSALRFDVASGVTRPTSAAKALLAGAGVAGAAGGSDAECGLLTRALGVIFDFRFLTFDWEIGATSGCGEAGEDSDAESGSFEDELRGPEEEKEEEEEKDFPTRRRKRRSMRLTRRRDSLSLRSRSSSSFWSSVAVD